MNHRIAAVLISVAYILEASRELNQDTIEPFYRFALRDDITEPKSLNLLKLAISFSRPSLVLLQVTRVVTEDEGHEDAKHQS